MTKKCKTVNIPAVPEYNSLKALGGGGKYEAVAAISFSTAASHQGGFLQRVHLTVFRQHSDCTPSCKPAGCTQLATFKHSKPKAVTDMHPNFSPGFKLPAKVSFGLMFAVRIVSRWVHLIRSSRSGWPVISTKSTSPCFSCWHCCWKTLTELLRLSSREKEEASLPWSVYQLRVELFPTGIRVQTKHIINITKIRLLRPAFNVFNAWRCVFDEQNNNDGRELWTFPRMGLQPPLPHLQLFVMMRTY